MKTIKTILKIIFGGFLAILAAGLIIPNYLRNKTAITSGFSEGVASQKAIASGLKVSSGQVIGVLIFFVVVFFLLRFLVRRFINR